MTQMKFMNWTLILFIILILNIKFIDFKVNNMNMKKKKEIKIPKMKW